MENLTPYFDQSIETIDYKISGVESYETLTLNDMDYSRLCLKLWEDNQACIKAITNGRCKKGNLGHIPMKVHWLKKNVHTKIFNVEYVETSEQLADIFTKRVGVTTLRHLRPEIGVKSY